MNLKRIHASELLNIFVYNTLPHVNRKHSNTNIFGACFFRRIFFLFIIYFIIIHGVSFVYMIRNSVIYWIHLIFNAKFNEILFWWGRHIKDDLEHTHIRFCIFLVLIKICIFMAVNLSIWCNKRLHCYKQMTIHD